MGIIHYTYVWLSIIDDALAYTPLHNLCCQVVAARAYGDVVQQDNTCVTNIYGRPVAAFVGVDGNGRYECHIQLQYRRLCHAMHPHAHTQTCLCTRAAPANLDNGLHSRLALDTLSLPCIPISL
jgi:hypothetical protein